MSEEFEASSEPTSRKRDLTRRQQTDQARDRSGYREHLSYTKRHRPSTHGGTRQWTENTEPGAVNNTDRSFTEEPTPDYTDDYDREGKIIDRTKRISQAQDWFEVEASPAQPNGYDHEEWQDDFRKYVSRVPYRGETPGPLGLAKNFEESLLETIRTGERLHGIQKFTVDLGAQAVGALGRSHQGLGNGKSSIPISAKHLRGRGYASAGKPSQPWLFGPFGPGRKQI